jgi:hypothetical protein
VKGRRGAHTGGVLITDAGVATVQAAIDRAWLAGAAYDEISVDTGLMYRHDDPVRIRIRRRGRRYDLSDDGAAVALAGRPTGWLEVVDHITADDGFNVNRRGVVGVPVAEGRDIALLSLRLAQSSRTAYLALLELSAQAVG